MKKKKKKKKKHIQLYMILSCCKKNIFTNTHIHDNFLLWYNRRIYTHKQTNLLSLRTGYLTNRRHLSSETRNFPAPPSLSKSSTGSHTSMNLSCSASPSVTFQIFVFSSPEPWRCYSRDRRPLSPTQFPHICLQWFFIVFIFT